MKIKLTMYLCTTLIFLIAFYDLWVTATSDSIAPSVSIWFAGFGCYFVPVFGTSFLIGHFWGTKPNPDAKPSKMAHWKFAVTVGTIVATPYDVSTLEFGRASMALSSWPPLMKLAQFPLLVIGLGVLSGKYLGKMSPTKPAGK